jgi:cyclic di-GMP phosphodiesterase
MSTHVLVVDDEPGVRDVLTAWLEAAGYSCAQASDADEALALAADREPDVALLDLAMPGRDGVWLAREFRRRWTDVALIMVTGLQRFDAAVEGMRLGVRDYLVKPFSRAELVQAVRRAAEWRESLAGQRAEHEALQREIASRSRAMAEAFAAVQGASMATLEALLATLNGRDPDAADHAVRIARMADRLCDALGIAEPARADILRGALLHDIGKIALPDALVYKAGPLTEDEIALIRRHPQLGYDILSRVPSLVAPAEIIRASHEAWDGTGYPHGLAGRQIPMGSRVVAVVDTFDALTWGRRHRDPVGYARAAAELVRSSGHQFDPEVVNRWLRVAEDADWSAPGAETLTGLSFVGGAKVLA